MSVESLNFTLALGTIALQIGAIAILALFSLQNYYPFLQKLGDFLRTWGLWIALALSFAASALTLVYSEILGFPPCPLCWWQRIFLYPQVVLFALALWKGERRVIDYSIALSIFGLGFALYHHMLQILPSGTLPCPADGTVSCAQRLVFEFGYVTFPMMAVSAFVFLLALMWFVRKSSSQAV